MATEPTHSQKHPMPFLPVVKADTFTESVKVFSADKRATGVRVENCSKDVMIRVYFSDPLTGGLPAALLHVATADNNGTGGVIQLDNFQGDLWISCEAETTGIYRAVQW